MCSTHFLKCFTFFLVFTEVVVVVWLDRRHKVCFTTCCHSPSCCLSYLRIYTSLLSSTMTPANWPDLMSYRRNSTLWGGLFLSFMCARGYWVTFWSYSHLTSLASINHTSRMARRRGVWVTFVSCSVLSLFVVWYFELLVCTGEWACVVCMYYRSVLLVVYSVSRKGRDGEELYICWLKSIERVNSLSQNTRLNYCPIHWFF